MGTTAEDEIDEENDQTIDRDGDWKKINLYVGRSDQSRVKNDPNEHELRA